MLPTVVLFVGIVLVPIIMSGYYSLLEWNGIGEANFIGFANYIELFQDTRALNSIKNMPRRRITKPT